MPFETEAEWNRLVDRVAMNERDREALRRQFQEISDTGKANNVLLNRIARLQEAAMAQQTLQWRTQMKTLDDVIADVTDLGTKEDSLIGVTSGIKAQLDAVLAGSLPPDKQAQVDSIFAAVEARKTTIQAAIDANTPPATPAPAPAPAP